METTTTAAFAMYITFYIALTLLSVTWIYSIISRCCRRSTPSNSDLGPATTIILFSTNREPVRGLESSVIEGFPKFAYMDMDKDTDTDTGIDMKMKKVSECVVCLGAFEEKEMVRLLPKCGHVFHVDCVDTWLQSHSTCPFCRANLSTSDRTSSEVVVDLDH